MSISKKLTAEKKKKAAIIKRAAAKIIAGKTDGFVLTAQITKTGIDIDGVGHQFTQGHMMKVISGLVEKTFPEIKALSDLFDKVLNSLPSSSAAKPKKK